MLSFCKLKMINSYTFEVSTSEVKLLNSGLLKRAEF